MKILFWVPYPKEGASNRYRVEQFLPTLENAGIEYDLHPFWNSAAFRILYKDGRYLRKFYFFVIGTFFRLVDILNIFNYDFVFIHREAFPIGCVFLEGILSKLKKPFIFDFDDAIFISSSSIPNSFIEKLKNPQKINKIIKLCECVIAGNGYLADFALRYNSNVSIIPTSIDTDKYYPMHSRRDDRVTIGWIGSITTLHFLKLLNNVFLGLSRRFPQLKLMIIGGNFSLDGFSDITCIPWSMENEISEMKSFDIGIMPMPDNEWTRGKCGFKAILYMSMAIPCVCSAVGVNKEIIISGENGFLAETEDEWMSKLSLLIEDCQLRKRIGLAGRAIVEERYSVKVNAPKFLEIIQMVYQR